MPISLPQELPAKRTLKKENIYTLSIAANSGAIAQAQRGQSARALKVLLLNLMPTKVETETQFARVLGNTPLPVKLELLHMSSHIAKHTSNQHIDSFYKTFDQIKDEYYDGMIITGAPVEQVSFEEVDYWPELERIMDWSKEHVYSTLHVCWGSQAALYHHYGINKTRLPKKLFGVFDHHVVRQGSILFRGFDDVFRVPHARHTTVKRADYERCPGLRILAEGDEVGVLAAANDGGRQIFITGHFEYDAETLQFEYDRDKDIDPTLEVPKNYYPDDDPGETPLCTWRASGNLLYSNWLNYYVNQPRPFCGASATGN